MLQVVTRYGEIWAFSVQLIGNSVIVMSHDKSGCVRIDPFYLSEIFYMEGDG